MPRPSRKQAILESLAHELAAQSGNRITTASLAASAGVSEAALYRHFASKAKIFEALIEFAEESVFSRINKVLSESQETVARCYGICYLLLAFADRNPGITRLLLGDALTGENERLHKRVEQFFNRLETQLRQVLREAGMRNERESVVEPEVAARFIVDWSEGRLHHYRRSIFTTSPMDGLEQSWALVVKAVF
ncbi:nucleoid occlusion factor SlmA [Solemya elarraichensis gill symbiont]|uniref:Nucleoid occlusion factor SlmA n=1 Tax=Solemya elarraichensis gill symbiont TaxID=1918949 RepID=A0A1T2LDS3_9GAMM|nr:nucleoid occlusion factor SlmA [Solemya elarraichensis gill symbiont]OOZ43096.1 nucleoid occlusion factor SlmA [Solemya elarraichensis gill symbiont]